MGSLSTDLFAFASAMPGAHCQTCSHSSLTTEWVLLRTRLLEEIDSKLDALRFYFLEADVRVERHGAEPAWDLDGPLVV